MSIEEKTVAPARTADQPEYLSPWRRIFIVLNICLSILLNTSMVEAIVIPLPAIQKSLDIETSQLQWTISAYSVGYSAFLLLAGRLADVYGAKKMYLGGLSFFSIWTLASGFAPNKIALFILRALQGASAAFTIPPGISILGSNFESGPAKTWAFTCYSAFSALGLSLGSIFGGVLTQYSRPGWRTIFYVTVGVSTLLTAQAYWVMPRDRKLGLEDNTVDWIGAVLIVFGIVLFVFGLAQSETTASGWATPYIPAVFAIGCVLMGAFWFWEWRRERKTSHPPLMPTSLWKISRFSAVQGIGFLSWSAFTVQEYYAVLYYVQYEGLDAIQTTLRFIPMAVTGVIANVIVGALVPYVPAQALLIVGAVGTSLAPILFAIQDPKATYWSYQFVAMIVTTLGADCSETVGLIIGSDSAGERNQGIAGGIFNTMNQLGTAVGLAIMTIIYEKVLHREAVKASLPFTHGIENTVGSPVILKALRAAFWGVAAFGLVTLLFSIVFFRGVGKVTHAAPKLKQDEEEGHSDGATLKADEESAKEESV